MQLKRVLLLFWAFWFLIVFLTNLFDVLRVWHLLDSNWPAVSDNYFLIQKTTSIYNLPPSVSDLFFFSALFWEAFCCGFFFQSAIRLQAPEAKSHTDRAFTAAVVLFGIFALACEVFIAYELEGTHLRILTALLASYVVIRL